MNDMTAVIVPKSDQINADDLIAGPRSFTIEAVAINPGTEQPVNIKLVGEPRVWRPCKSMSRVLVAAWGPDAKVYAGRSLTLYRDPKVKWGGMEIGGIRVSHLSHIERDMLLQLTATKGKRAPHVVKPLEDAPTPPKTKQTAEQWASEHRAKVDEAADLAALDTLIAKGKNAMAKLQADKPELWEGINTAYAARRAALTSEGKPDADMDEGFTDDEEFGE